MRVRELEFGGVWNIGGYENVRLCVRVATEGREAGDVLAELMQLVRDLAEFSVAVRQAYRARERLLDMWKRSLEEAEIKSRRLEARREEYREEARRRLEKINLELLPEDVRRQITEEPLKAFCLGVLDPSCVNLRELDWLKQEADQARKEAEEYQRKAEEVKSLVDGIIRELRQGALPKNQVRRLRELVKPYQNGW